jgi:hypothetical protein
MAKPSMTMADVEAFREWHEKRLKELNYPTEMTEKLQRDRERWLPKPKQ